MSFHANFAQDRERLFGLRRAADPCDLGQDALFHAAIGHRRQDAFALTRPEAAERIDLFRGSVDNEGLSAFGIEARI